MRDNADNAPAADVSPPPWRYSAEGKKKHVRPFETLGRKHLFEDDDEDEND
jgi:hypothetical protein